MSRAPPGPLRGVPEQERVLREGPGVARVRVVGPVQVARSTAIRAIDAAVAGARLEVLGDVVGHEHRDAAGAAVRERGLDDQPQVGLGGHVIHSVVDEHRIEVAAQPDRAHVRLDVLAAGVKPPRHREHRARGVHQGHGQPRRQVAGAVPAAAAQFQHLVHRAAGLAEQPRRERGLFGILLRRGDERPPFRQVLVEPVIRLVPAMHPSFTRAVDTDWRSRPPGPARLEDHHVPRFSN